MGAARPDNNVICVWVLLLVLAIGSLSADACSGDFECGWEATCTNNTVCTCPIGLTLHTDGKNCRDTSCSSNECLECLDQPSVCTRCVSFMSSSSGLCLSKCEGSAERKGNNIMCTEEEEDDRDVDIVIAVVAGVGAGAVLCVLIILGVCLYLRKTRKKINLQSQRYRNGQMEIGHVKQYPTFDNSAFETDSQMEYRPGKIDPLEYVNELDRLRPHTDTLMALLSQVKAKTRAMSSSDPRVSTYKGVIHQLCRVLVLLHKKDPVVSIPSDALSLLQWAQQMLDDHREQQSSSGGTAEYPIAKISAVDEVMQNPTSPVYATPNDSNFGQQGSPFSPLANPYSSVPVPLPSQEEAVKQQRRSSRNSGYATIRRTPSIPNGDLINSVENNEHHNQQQHHQLHHHQHHHSDIPVMEMEPVNVSTFSSPHQEGGVGYLRKEDFSSFLINNGKTSSEEQSTLDRNKGNINTNTNTEDARRLSLRREPPPEIFNTSSESYGDIDFSGGYYTQTTQQPTSQAQINVHQQQQPHNNLHHHHTSYDESSDEVVLRNKDKSIKSGQVFADSRSSTPTVKKNIITNPNAFKKSSFVSKKSTVDESVKSSSSIGYFANGHFYDPNPSSTVPDPEPEVYAPGSSYSERSNIMSTFLGDLPQSRTPSESDHSDDGGAESDNSGGDLDVFPFDPNEATNPVEV